MNRALAAHFALASWFACVASRRDTSRHGIFSLDVKSCYQSQVDRFIPKLGNLQLKLRTVEALRCFES